MLVYFTWLEVYVFLPIALLWITNPRLIWRYKKTLGFCVIGSLVVSIPWDIWATQTNAWFFPKTSVIGIYILNLPIEEFFFISFVSLLMATIALILRDRLGKYLLSDKVIT